MEGNEQEMPQPGMYAKQMVKDPRNKLRDLVKAGSFKIAAVDILPKSVIFYLVEPASEVGYKARLCGRQIKDEHQRPKNTKHTAPSFLLGSLRG